MRIMLSLAWRNLWRQPRRTWLTASAIAFSTTFLVFIVTLQLGAFDLMIETSTSVFTGQAQIQSAGYQKKPQIWNTVPDAARLAAAFRFEIPQGRFSARSNGFALLSSGSRSYGALVAGVEPDHEADVSNIPRALSSGRWFSGPHSQEIVLGAAIARNLQAKVGSEITLLSSGKDGSVAATVLKVAGIFNSPAPELNRSLAEIPLETFQETFNMGSDGHAVVAAGPSLKELGAFKEAVARHLPDGDKELVILGWQDLVPGLEQLIRVDTVEHWFLYSILLLIVTFSVLNTFLMSVLERTHEFGVLLALGLSARRIGGLVLTESFLIATLGLSIGGAIGGAIVAWFHWRGFMLPGMGELYARFGVSGRIYPRITVVAVLIGPLVVFAFTMLAAVLPALRLRRLDAVQAMKEI